MKVLGSAALALGIVSMVAGVILRIMEKQIALGLAPSSFLEFSVACFLLTIALNTIGKSS